MNYVAITFAWLYVGIVELAPLPQIYKLNKIRKADQMSVGFAVALALGRLMGLPYAFDKGAAVIGWGLLVGAVLRIILLLQMLHYRRIHELHKRLREDEVTI